MSRPVMQRAIARAEARDRIEAQIAEATDTLSLVLVGALLKRRLIFCYAYEPDQIEGRVRTFKENGTYTAEFDGEGGEAFAAFLQTPPALPVIGPTIMYRENPAAAFAPVRALVDVAEFVNADAETFAFTRLSARLASEFGIPVEEQKPRDGADVDRFEGEPNLYTVEIVGPDGATYGASYREGAEDIQPGIVYSVAPGFDFYEVETKAQRDAHRRRCKGETIVTDGGAA